jgi:hypothetical protein
MGMSKKKERKLHITFEQHSYFRFSYVWDFHGRENVDCAPLGYVAECPGTYSLQFLKTDTFLRNVGKYILAILIVGYFE